MSSLPEHLLHLATLELVTRSSPFTHAKSIPLHVLSDLVGDYITLLASAAKANADLAGRHKPSVWDVGRALEEFGTASWAELSDDVEHSDGGGDEGQRIRDLAGGLKELLDPVPPQEPIAQLGYNPLSSTELNALVLHKEPPDEYDSSSDEDSELHTPPPFSPTHVRVKHEDSDHLDLEDAVPTATTSWRDPSLIPAYVPDFLPPFPGMERETDIPEGVRRRRDKERERDVAAAAWAGANTALSSRDPWIATIPYSSSTLLDMHPASLLPSLSPPPSPSTRKRQRSLSPPATSSLNSYREFAKDINHEPAFKRINPQRRIAASAISISSDQSLYGDSLFGNVPVPFVRHASLAPGFLPDNAIPHVHPFNTALPHTISTALPARPAPNAPLLAPTAHPRIPTIMGSIAAHLAQPTAPHLALFSRLTRTGPPGPLGNRGEANDYEYKGQSAMLETNVEWAQRAYNQRLPGAPEGEGGTGIKLSLKLGRNGSVTAAGSPAGTPVASGSGWPGTPFGGGAAGGGGGGTDSPASFAPQDQAGGSYFAAGDGTGEHMASVAEEPGTAPVTGGLAYEPFDPAAFGLDPSAGVALDTEALLQQLDAIPATPFEASGSGLPPPASGGLYDPGLAFDVDSLVADLNAGLPIEGMYAGVGAVGVTGLEEGEGAGVA